MVVNTEWNTRTRRKNDWNPLEAPKNIIGTIFSVDSVKNLFFAGQQT